MIMTMEDKFNYKKYEMVAQISIRLLIVIKR